MHRSLRFGLPLLLLLLLLLFFKVIITSFVIIMVKIAMREVVIEVVG
jgi:hypothetical protein